MTGKFTWTAEALARAAVASEVQKKAPGVLDALKRYADIPGDEGRNMHIATASEAIFGEPYEVTKAKLDSLAAKLNAA